MRVVCGRKPVIEALSGGEAIEKIYLLFGQRGEVIDKIRIEAKRKNIPVTQLPADKFNRLGVTANHQGVIAVLPSQKTESLEFLLEYSLQRHKLLVALDSIQDPHNVGAIIRSAECAGADGLIITRHNSAPLSDTVSKVSAGAINHQKIAVVNNLVRSLEEAKKAGYWITGAMLSEKALPYTEIDFSLPTIIVVGNEESGIRKLTSEKCDFLAYIPMQGKIQSLNVSVATGIFLFEVLKQRTQKTP